MTQRTFVVGTAGHVDHGKSTLVRALTGIDPDRLQEEKERALTIDLGFAWLQLPGGSDLSIVDVPGHERFIKNMLAGVGGIDAALLIVAADEGPMPQTREHLAILDLLGIQTGMVVITKRDLVDQDWLDLVTEETRETLVGTVFESAPIHAISGTTGAGLQELIEALETLLLALPEQQMRGKPRLAVDRVFSVLGFGTVVTGTLLGDVLELGLDVELLPSGLPARIRGLQVHGKTVSTARPGSRTAVNLSGVDKDQVSRGDLLTVRNWMQPTTIVDARLRLISNAPKALEQNDPVDFFVGASERQAHITLLDNQLIEPGAGAWVQLRFEDPVAVTEGDLFIVRQASPSLTIGGGTVMNAHPRRHRRFRDDVIRDLETRATGSPVDRLVQRVNEGVLTLREANRELDVGLEDLRSFAQQAANEDRIVMPGSDSGQVSPGQLLMAPEMFAELRNRIVGLLQSYHARNPLRPGMPKEEVRSRINLDPRSYEAVLRDFVKSGVVEDRGEALKRPEFEVILSADQESQAQRYIAALEEEPNAPPSPDLFDLPIDVLSVLEDRGQLVRIADNVVFSSGNLERIKQETLEIIEREGDIALASFRDHFGSSRKYAQAVLEYFDAQRITRRVGDVRVAYSG